MVWRNAILVRDSAQFPRLNNLLNSWFLHALNMKNDLTFAAIGTNRYKIDCASLTDMNGASMNELLHSWGGKLEKFPKFKFNPFVIVEQRTARESPEKKSEPLNTVESISALNHQRKKSKN